MHFAHAMGRLDPVTLPAVGQATLQDAAISPESSPLPLDEPAKAPHNSGLVRANETLLHHAVAGDWATPAGGTQESGRRALRGPDQGRARLFGTQAT